jgi:hypothetical protein
VSFQDPVHLHLSIWTHYSEEDHILAPSSPSSELTGQGVDPYEHYAEAALADCSGFFQISKVLFVVQGWDVKGQRSTVSQPNLLEDLSQHRTAHWNIFRHHGIICSTFILGMNSALHAPATSQAAVSMQGFYENIRKRSSWKWENLVQAVGAENNQTLFHFSDALEDDSVVLFSHQSNGHRGFENLFSVPTPGQQHLNSCSVVSHYGMDTEVWKCPKDRIHDCIHIRNARDHLQKLIINEHSALGGHI